jgi:RecB family exonuclease
VDGPISEDDFDRTCRQEVGSHLSGSMASLGLKPSEFRAITANVEELYERFKHVPTVGFEGAEVAVEGEPAEGIRLRGRVDAVFSDEDGIRIVDWKTGSYLDDAEAQLDFYAMAWRVTKGVLPVRMEALSLKTGEQRVFVPTDEAVVATESIVADMITELRAAMAAQSELTRTAGPHCRWCPLLEDCTEGATALAILD